MRESRWSKDEVQSDLADVFSCLRGRVDPLPMPAPMKGEKDKPEVPMFVSVICSDKTFAKCS